ncbi:hypothetical protein LWI29_024163 [Acer saccharum]|uniref:Reverse transcriptase domain-containing protein n=1 Tax=Acer saccharum TaxID=4024 RepID=A0AA39RY57_ACESA|nr:hypothetical protein LWI29_024163 [Acer saccharum]
MSREVTNDEIREVCFSLHPNKAPGPDGYNAHFFKKTWHIVSDDVINAIQEFFRSGLLLKKLNATILALVPKVPNPSKMTDFRPISCCNTLYKIIAKIIANRIKPCLLDIISPSQSAFVVGRRIGDNILLVQEILRNYHKDANTPKVALKSNHQDTQDIQVLQHANIVNLEIYMRENDKQSNEMEASIHRIEFQIGQLAELLQERENGRFPSQPKQVREMEVLRSGKVLGDSNKKRKTRLR